MHNFAVQAILCLFWKGPRLFWLESGLADAQTESTDPFQRQLDAKIFFQAHNLSPFWKWDFELILQLCVQWGKVANNAIYVPTLWHWVKCSGINVQESLVEIELPLKLFLITLLSRLQGTPAQDLRQSKEK